MLIIISIICSFLILVLIGYPLIAFIRFLFFKVPILRSELYLQPISIIIAAYHEDRYLSEKINSFLDEQEWIEGSEIIVVVSGATSSTLQILEEIKNQDKVKFLVFSNKVSKIQSVNLAAGIARNEIMVFSDCRQKMKKMSVKNLIHNFNDPSVGTVVATLKDSDSEKKESFFRRLLTFIAKCDSHTGSSLNVYGALYAQRKYLFRKFPENILFDDLFVVVSTLSQNHRLIQEENAVIYDVSFNTYYKSERIQRLARGLLLFLKEQKALFLKLKFFDLLRLLIFKYLKLLIPFLLFIQAICLFIYTFQTHDFRILATIILIFFPMLIIEKLRSILFLFIRINYHFMLMILKFVFLKERSTNWDKLEVK